MNVHLQNSLIIVKEIIKIPALILTNVEKMVRVRNTMVEQEKSMCFNFFTLNQVHTVQSRFSDIKFSDNL